MGDEARINLALMNDGKSRRKLLDPYDARIKKNPGWAQAYRDRGTLLLELRDYRGAQRDFREAIKILTEKKQPRSEVWLLMARCHARDGRLKNAAEDLRNASLGASELKALRDDPDFAELAASRYGKIFGD